MAQEIHFTLNGRPVATRVRADDTLVEVLGNMDLRGPRESCGQGLCGCCTVHVDGVPVSGCLHLAVMADGAEVTTIEGLEQHGRLHPVQQAFIDAGAFQCGFCTPGFIMMITKLLETNPQPTDEEIRHYLVGNLCRCSSYPEILAAVRLAADRLAAA